MSYVNTKTKEIVEVIDIIRENSNVSFPTGPWPDEMISSLGYAELNFPEILAPGPYETLVEGIPTKAKDGKWYRSFTKKQISDEDKLIVLANEWHKVREERAKRLLESDWTQLPDAPVNKEEWSAYRQELRDITDSLEDPFNVEWPSPPVSTQRV